MITVQQIRAARAMLGLKQQELAQRAGISTGTLNNIERGVQTDPKLSTLRSIQRSLENNGIEFLFEDTGGIGIRLKSQSTGNHIVLIIDDSRADRTLYASWLNKQHDRQYTLIEASSAKEGYEAFLSHSPSCIILDFMMYGKDGFQLLAQMKKEHVQLPPIIFVTAMPSEAVKKDVMALGAKAYLDKKTLTREVLYRNVNQVLGR